MVGDLNFCPLSDDAVRNITSFLDSHELKASMETKTVIGSDAAYFYSFDGLSMKKMRSYRITHTDQIKILIQQDVIMFDLFI
jgi:hypothetical protein